MVKEFFKGHAAGCICPPGLPQCVCGHEPTMRVLTRKPVTPRAAEAESNPRSKSAKLRVAVRLEELSRWPRPHSTARRAPAPRRERGGAAARRRPTRTARRRRGAARRSAPRFMRTFVVFVVCLTVLAVGRVALSFAVVQKTLQTDAVVHEQRACERRERRGSRKSSPSSPRPCASATSPRPSSASSTRPHLTYLRAAEAQDGRRGRGEPLMAAPLDRTSSRGRPARRRPASREPAAAARGGHGVDGRIRLLRFVVPRLPGARRRQGRGAGVVVGSTSRRSPRTSRPPTVALPAHRGSILDRNGDELAVGQAAADRVRDPHLLQDPEGRGGRALRRAADQPPSRIAATWRRRWPRARRDKRFAYVARKVDPELAKAALALDLPGVGSYAEEERTYPLKGTAAQVLGFAGMDNNGPRRHGAAVRQGALGRGRQRDHRARPRRPRPEDRRASTSPSPAPERAPHARRARSSTTRRTCSRRRVRDTGGKSAVSIVMDPRTGEVLAMANVTR